MTRTIAILVASAGLLFACASPDDDSWQGAAGDELDEGGAGGTGPSKKNGTTASGSTVAETTSAGPTTSTTVTTGSTTAAATTSGGGCDTGSCESCQSCAMNGPCASTIDACFNDADCYALIECLNTCVDDVCANACADAHPSGMQLYIAAADCVFCVQCPATCGAC
jgi:hypothetical protein